MPTLIQLAIISFYLFLRWNDNPLDRIPTVGPWFPLLSYVGAFRFLTHAREVIQEGYNLKCFAFKVALLDRWLVIVKGATLNEELSRYPEEVMSFQAAANELVQPVYTVARDASLNLIHIKAIREKLPRNLARLFPAVLEEVELSLDELMPPRETWVPIKAFPVVARIVARASNRVFVGAPLCRDEHLLDVVCDYPNQVMKGAGVLTFCPSFLKRVVGPLLPWPRRAIRAIKPLIKGTIDERRRLLKQHDSKGEEWPNKPNNVLMWMMEEMRRTGTAHSEDLLVQAVLAANFAAIHTSTITFTHALYHLAANPEYAKPLREEIEQVIAEDGWTKASMSRMWGLDSFLKESQRMNGVSALSITRRAQRDVKLSDGTFLPAGTLVSGALSATHHDGDYYGNPEVFDGFRFARVRAAVSEAERGRHLYVSTSSWSIGFGHGRQACPGRFFAALELKVLLACIVLRYDVKFREEGRRPENEWLATTCYPCRTAEVLFRRRGVSDKC